MIKFIVSLFEERSPEQDLDRAFMAAAACWIITAFASLWIQGLWIDLISLTVTMYGLYKKNRWAATTLFVLYTGGKIFDMATTGRFTGLMSLVFIYLFYKGMIAAFKMDPSVEEKGDRHDVVDYTKCPKCKASIINMKNRCFECGASLVALK